jgi:hypothetical protein
VSLELDPLHPKSLDFMIAKITTRVVAGERAETLRTRGYFVVHLGEALHTTDP